MPAPKPAAQVQALGKPKEDAEQQMKDAELTPERLKKANDPRFSSVLSQKGTVEKLATAAPGKYVAAEGATLGQAKAKASGDAKAGVAQMGGVKLSGNSKVKARQLLAKQKDEARRKAVTDHIETLYAKTKQKVDLKLSTLEADVMRLFDVGAEAALADMKSYANREIDKFKDDRYSGITGGARWLADLFRPVPEGIKVILGQARTRFASKMDALAVRISAMVDGRLADAKAEVDKGQAAIKTYVESLPRDLQAVGREAQQAMTERFEELRNGIDSKKNDLAQKLAQKYKEAHDKADSALKKLEEENAGALKKLADAIGEVIKILSEFKDKLMAVLRKGLETIKLILSDPIGFLGNLLAAVKQGFTQFVGNIWAHLKKGFMEWLFGSLASAGIQVPSDLNVWSILKLVLDVLGLTYAWMRGEAVKLIGERNVAMVEKLVEYISVTIKGGPQALWEKLKEDLSNLKAMVIDAIQNWLIETIVKQAVTKILSMFNPAGAIVQAIIAIYNVVMWVIENASRILALIEAVVNSVHAIATGAIGGAATWIEKALASLIPIVISFLARLIGLGGISAKIKEFITKVQTKVRAAVLGWLKKAWAYVKKLFGGGGKGKADDKRTEAQKKDDLDKGVNEATQLLKDPKLSSRAVSKKLAAIKRTYKMTDLSLVVTSKEGVKEKVHVHGAINPDKDGPDAEKITEMESITVDFNMKKELDEVEFHRQLAESQGVLDDMTVEQWIARRESFYQRKAERKKAGFKNPEGRDPAGTAAQAKAKEKAILAETAKLANADPKLSLEDARKMAEASLKDKVATHKLDQVAGGSGIELSETLGGAREDFSIGAAWVHKARKVFAKVKDLPDDVKKQKLKIVITVNGGPLKK
ncbi:polymorphic toxin type 15 domain-containing protein [Pyxidicoccus sp. 3LFB2]